MNKRANRLGMFSDVQQILDAALASGGGEYELESYGAAVHWRQRAYRFRKLFAEAVSHISKYDRLTFPSIRPGTATVHIKLIEAKGIFKPAGEPRPTDLVDSDDLLSAAELFAKKLGE